MTSHTYSNARRVGDDRVVVTLVGEYDMATLGELNDVLEQALTGEPGEVVVDLARTTFVDSLTLGTLTAAAKRQWARSASFRVVHAVEPEVRRVLAITGLDRHLCGDGSESE